MRITSGLLTGHVLQRTASGASVTVRGESTTPGAVKATITAGRKALKGWSDKVVGKSAKGVFSATLNSIPTGGPYTVTLTLGERRVVVQQVFVGDLWLMAGQSNMEGVGNLADAPKPHPLVRNFNMDHRWSQARDPLHHLNESPDVVHNGGAQQALADREPAKRGRVKGTGVGVYFGIAMHRRTGVPQGLIATAHGGTSMDQWDQAKRTLGGGSLYGSMLSSLADVGQPIAGVLWYQGCSDTGPDTAPLFTERMKKLVAAVRADQHQPKLPWIQVQIARVVGQSGGEREWNSIQEQQRLLSTVIPHLDTVAAIDLELDDLIHISGKAYATLGERMALAASRLALGEERAVPAIQVASVKEVIDHPYGAALEVTFSNVVGELRSAGLPLGFTLVDREHQKHDVIYKTTLDGNRAILELVNQDRSDLRVMYGWGKAPACNITDGRNLAVPVFGPLAPSNRAPVSQWLRTWDVSAIRAGEEVAKMPQPTTRNMGVLKRRSWTSQFIDNHATWQHTSGHVAFLSSITLTEAMELELRTGYDGPFRLWVDSTEVVTDLNGTNPAIADIVRKPLKLAKGTHKVTVLMALNGGRAWGFFLRFARLKVPAAVIEAGTVVVPVPLG